MSRSASAGAGAQGLLIDHTRPARKNARELDIELHDVVIDGDRAAARYTMRVLMRREKSLEIEVHVFAHLAPGRGRRIDSLTRTLPPKD
ncbi:nuclear transport factor 2 family protein [Sinosporangium siamense]|uniref:nuclear transport factor 2 family protein n=1 Tax=Sinosporangium siamense TaxID=1367973 RepID=UPI0035F03277